MSKRGTAKPGTGASSLTDRWEFWVDVGGTFTDCLARCPGGSITTYKLLSSGKIKGRVGPGSSGSAIVDPARARDPRRFFEGYTLVLYGADGDREIKPEKVKGQWGNMGQEQEQGALAQVEVAGFDNGSGTLWLSRELSFEPEVGMRYELYSGEEAPLTGVRWLLGLRLEQEMGPVTVRMGTTRGTNALLEKQGARAAFVTTRGFGGILEIAYQDRPDLFALQVQKSAPLYLEAVELDERIDSQGNVLVPLQEEAVEVELLRLLEQGIDTLAVCLLNAYTNGSHEDKVDRVARRLGFNHVSRSAEVVPLQRIVARGETTMVDAYLTPVIRDYIKQIRSGLPEAGLKLMTNTGGLVAAEAFSGKDSILSGPAGGVVGYSRVARDAGFPQAIGFDMGGTSTDVSRFHGDFDLRFEMEIDDPESRGGIRLVSPMLWIETVAAGGGSICRFDGQLPRVGPRSAGADPGPACYGRGGPLTVTDINLFLGRVLPDYFAFPLTVEAVEDRLDEIIARMNALGAFYSREELAEGFFQIANSTIAAAIKKISVARGYDVRDYVLVAFGGAGPQHACPIARELGIGRILLHPYGSILSAYGMGMADVKKYSQRPVGKRYNKETLQDLESLFQEMEQKLNKEVRAEGVPEQRILAPRRMLDLRYRGQESTLTITCPADGDYRQAFEAQHRQQYGFIYPDRGLEIHAARVEVVGETEKPGQVAAELEEKEPPTQGKSLFYAHGGWCEAKMYSRTDLRPGHRISGPAIVIEQGSTLVVDPGWNGEVTPLNNILLTDMEGCDEAVKEEKSHLCQEKAGSSEGLSAGEKGVCLQQERKNPSGHQGHHGDQDRKRDQQQGRGVDLVTLELFNNTFSSIAGQMGATLQKTALSTNVKERLDFSCAVFTAGGDLVANAPHIPVHLGAMPASVQYLIESFPRMQPGQVYITNDPFHGGSHLPDVTVVTPVYDSTGERLLFFTANRAHHAEIGGVTPGSMPPFARSLAEEGVLIQAFPFVSADRASEERLKALLLGARHPTRAIKDNLADIYAQVAANQTGAARLLELVQNYGLEQVVEYMGHIQDAAERMMGSALARIHPGEYSFQDYLDDGSSLAVKIQVVHYREKGMLQGRAVVDFHGTGPVVKSSLNANRAIVTSAVLYSFRCLMEEDVPLNAGILRPITIILPENCLLNPPISDDPEKCPAVSGGNVETSQRVVDIVFGALQVAAASQGTMNNLSFGRKSAAGRPGLSYYETIGGGAGAGEGFSGASAVHTHMTNTRITDPEVLEARYPVRVRRFAIREQSGGNGAFRGGDGIIREIIFLESLEVSLLTGRRNTAPYGLIGGEPGKSGKNLLVRKDGSREELEWAAVFTAFPGDILVIETPGGGGFGRAGKVK